MFVQYLQDYKTKKKTKMKMFA